MISINYQFKHNVMWYFKKKFFFSFPEQLQPWIYVFLVGDNRYTSTCILLYCIVLYCIMRPYTDGPIGPLSYRHSSGVVRNPHSTLAE